MLVLIMLMMMLAMTTTIGYRVKQSAKQPLGQPETEMERFSRDQPIDLPLLVIQREAKEVLIS